MHYYKMKSQKNKNSSSRSKAGGSKKTVKPVAVTVEVANPSKSKARRAPKSAAVGKTLASTLASLIPGGAPFASLAGQAGSFLGDKIGTLLGLGEYEVKQNSVLSEGVTPPTMHEKSERVVVRHREYLGDIFSSATPGAFEVTNYALNPALSSTFPWMSQVAAAYRQWRPLGMVFEFKSNTGLISSAATPAVGMVIMATDYNAYDVAPFSNKREMDNNMYTTSAKTTESFYHPIECAPLRNVLGSYFTRVGNLPTNQPPQFYDLGVFAIASIGCPVASQNLGELWLTCEIEFDKSTLQNAQSDPVLADLFYNFSTTPYETGTVVGSLAQAIIPTPTNTLGCAVVSPGTAPTKPAFDIVFPQNAPLGDYIIMLFLTGYGGGGWANNMLRLDGSSINFVGANTEMFGESVWGPPPSPVLQYTFGTAAITSAWQNVFLRGHVTGPNAKAKFWWANGAAPTGTISGYRYLYITQVSQSVVMPAESDLLRTTLRANFAAKVNEAEREKKNKGKIQKEEMSCGDGVGPAVGVECCPIHPGGVPGFPRP